MSFTIFSVGNALIMTPEKIVGTFANVSVVGKLDLLYLCVNFGGHLPRKKIGGVRLLGHVC